MLFRSFVAFVLMPRIGDPRPEQAYFDAFERTFGVPLLFPPDAVLDALYTPDGYSDPNHLQKQGREVYSAWLARQLGGIWRGSLRVALPPHPGRSPRALSAAFGLAASADF